MNELVSIIITTYNLEKYIIKCIDSVIHQTYKNIEILVVDDGSVDNTKKIVCSKFDVNDRVKYFYKENGGLSSARNYGISRAKGVYIIFLDGDDYLDENYVQIMFNALTTQNADVASCLTNKNGKNKVFYRGVFLLNKEETLFEYLKGTNKYTESCCTKMYKCEIFDKLKFPINKIHEDTFTTYKIINNINKAIFVEYNGYNVCTREGSITRSPYSNKNYDKVVACKEIYEHYKNTKFHQLAFDKLIGSILFFIMKTNGSDLELNKKAYIDLEEILKDKECKIKIKYLFFVMMYKVKILKKVKI